MWNRTNSLKERTHTGDGKRIQNHVDCEMLQPDDHENWDLVGKAIVSTY